MIFAAGYHASGKSYFASVLTEQFPTIHVETSAVVRSLWREQGTETDLQVWAAGMESEHGENYFDDMIAKTIERDYRQAVNAGEKVQDVIITGNRSLEGIQYLTQRFEGTGLGVRPNVIIAMHADFLTLWKRFSERNRRPGDAIMKESDFKALTESETRRGIQDIFEHADHNVHNTDGRDEFRNWAVDFACTELGLTPREDVLDSWQLERRTSPEGAAFKPVR